MIDFRYHIVSLISVFLALALGIVVGTTALNGAVLSDLRKQVKGLKNDKHSLQEDTRSLQGQIKSDDTFARNVEPAVVAGRLSGKKVLLISAPRADGAVVSGVSKTIKDAGATVTAQVQLTDDYIDPRRAPDLKDFITSALPAGFSLPTTDDAGTLAGSLLSDVLAGKSGQKEPTSGERQQVLAGFGTLSVLRLRGTDIQPADLAVIVATDQPAGDNPGVGARSLSKLATALGTRSQGVVVAGTVAVAEDNGVIGAVRSDDTLSSKVSTVDNADRVSGQIVTTLALNEETKGKDGGQYGTASNASTAPPSLTVK